MSSITIIGVGPTSANLIDSAHTDDPIWASTGEVSHADPDDLVPGRPLPLRFARYYASLLSSNGVGSALGNNWMHNFDVRLAVSGSNDTVTLFRGQTVGFKQSGSTPCRT